MPGMAGIEQFRRRLAALDRKTRNKVIRQALRSGAKLMASAVKAGAPKRSGKLKRSVKVRAGRRKKDTISLQVVVTGGHASPMVGTVEYGAPGRGIAPQPFIRPGFESSKGPSAATALGELKRGIEQAGR